MAIPPTHTVESSAISDRSAARREVTERILEVTGQEAARVGPERIRMGEIAARANVSRASLYRYFASKDDLIRAWTTRELDAIFDRIDGALDGDASFEDRFAASFAQALAALRTHPVFRAVFAINDTQIMRSTLQSSDAIAHARDLCVARLNRAVERGQLEIGQFDAEVVGELLSRITISIAESPETTGRLTSESDAADFARRYLLPLVNGAAGAATRS